MVAVGAYTLQSYRAFFNAYVSWFTLTQARWKGVRVKASRSPLWVKKQTCAVQNVVSALHPIATAKAKFGKSGHVCFTRESGHARCNGMSALGQKRTSSRFSFDHLVGATYESVGDGDAERLGGPEVYDQFDFCGLLNWQIGRLFAPENAADIGANRAMLLRHAGAIANQTAGLCKFGETKGRW